MIKFPFLSGKSICFTNLDGLVPHPHLCALEQPSYGLLELHLSRLPGQQLAIANLADQVRIHGWTHLIERDWKRLKRDDCKS